MNFRSQAGKRTTSIPFIRPNIVLYGDAHPDGDEIAKTCNQDLGISTSTEGSADLLLVVGTSLRIKGVTDLVRKFSKSFSQRSSNDSIHMIYLNDSFPNIGSWVDVFDVWLKSDCQEFALSLLEEMGQEQSTFDSETLYSQRRLDQRPSWRWWT
jgi:NAD-dependent histone deacetylase SIR2